jgi:hypothetical protein
MTFPIAPHVYPICFAQSSTLMNIFEKMGYRGAHLFLFAAGGLKRCFYWGIPNVPKTLMVGQSI